MVVSRRDFVVGSTALLAAHRDAQAQTPDPSLTHLTATEAVGLLRSGDLTAENYTRALLQQALAQRALNALISQDGERLLESARPADRRRAAGASLNALHGLPVLIKD